MAKVRGRWQAAHKAWSRLLDWHATGGVSSASRADESLSALDVLSDIGVVRRMLDETELVAVRAARRAGKSWAEIATRLGITRQSAWERWRELDGESDAPSGADSGTDDLFGSVAAGIVEQALGEQAAREQAAREQVVRERRRRYNVTVPSVIGKTWDEAARLLAEVGLNAVGERSSGTVTDQIPESGAKVPWGAAVRLWLQGGEGGAGVREPRRPTPQGPKAARELKYSSQDLAG